MKTKQVLIWRKDLRTTEGNKCRTGKIAAQLAHASMAVLLNMGKLEEQHSDVHPDVILSKKYIIPLYEYNGIDHSGVIDWLTGIFTKVCVTCNSEEELLDLHAQALSAGLPCSLIEDAGLTEFGGVPTHTAVAIGPAESEDIDKITGGLKLL